MTSFQQEIEFQKKQLGIDSASLKAKSDIIEIPIDKLIFKMMNETPSHLISIHHKILSGSSIDQSFIKEIDQIPIEKEFFNGLVTSQTPFFLTLSKGLNLNRKLAELSIKVLKQELGI